MLGARRDAEPRSPVGSGQPGPAVGVAMSLRDDPGFPRVAEHLAREGGSGFALHQDPCFERRLRLRMRLRGAASLTQYAGLLDREPEELARLLKGFTVHVTGFFRNPAAWRRLGAVLAGEGRDGRETFRGWSAGCATGEEAYSLGMLLQSLLRRGRLPGRSWEVDGADIDASCLAIARDATYPAEALPTVRAEAGTGYGELVDGRFTVDREIRERVRFAQLDLTGETGPREAYHLALCRNVLIFFAGEGQD